MRRVGRRLPATRWCEKPRRRRVLGLVLVGAVLGLALHAARQLPSSSHPPPAGSAYRPRSSTIQRPSTDTGRNGDPKGRSGGIGSLGASGHGQARAGASPTPAALRGPSVTIREGAQQSEGDPRSIAPNRGPQTAAVGSLSHSTLGARETRGNSAASGASGDPQYVAEQVPDLWPAAGRATPIERDDDIDDDDRLVDLPSHCKKRHPTMLIYNRMPKTGSASLMALLQASAADSDRTLTIVQDEDHYKRRYTDKQLMKQSLMFLPPLQTRFRVMHSHQFFYDFAVLYHGNLEHINMIRDPVDRCVSSFYWTTRKPANGIFAVDLDINEFATSGGFNIKSPGFVDTPRFPITEPPSTWKQTKEELWAAQLADECNNYATKWFCGHSAGCMDGASPAALETALFHIQHKHLIVGVTEEFDVFVGMLQRLLPDFVHSDVLSSRQHGSVYPPPTDQTRELLVAKNKNDYLLYVEVKKLLLSKAAECGVVARSG